MKSLVSSLQSLLAEFVPTMKAFLLLVDRKENPMQLFGTREFQDEMTRILLVHFENLFDDQRTGI